MSLAAYARNAYHIGEELRGLLSAEDFQPMMSALNENALQQLAEFRHAHDERIRKTAQAQPKQRQTLLRKLSQKDQFWTIAAAAQMAFEAAAVLEMADLELRPGGSYRDMIGSVHQVLDAQYASDDASWPFFDPRPYQNR